MVSSLSIKVKGIVQGVGFRPFVYHLATQNSLTGWILNNSNGVEIEVTGAPPALAVFVDQLKNNPPPLAKINGVQIEYIENPIIYASFEIRESQSNETEFIPISPDISICGDCLHEMFDPNDRRFRYPFINCTNCGPRFSIVKDIPYDRQKTTMAEFDLCPQCLAEYENPSNRRFHAQPIACPTCGPQVQVIRNNKIEAIGEDAIQAARQSLQNGEIVAIKGLGGYHIAVDATNSSAVSSLRNRKKRSDKPFALMEYDIENIQKYCHVNQLEMDLLQSKAHPIVLLKKKGNDFLPTEIAPGQNSLGFMLPYTPLHYLLLQPDLDYPHVFVMTSGNISDEPIAYQDDDANVRLSEIADLFLIHNRPIHMRVDDSVVRIVNKHPYILRRSRGYAPEDLTFPFDFPSILATGAELKNTICLTRENQAFLSHHIGDMENIETLQSFEDAINHYEKLFRICPEIYACDLHPDYLATRYTMARSERENKQLIYVQHHHAHLAACLAENNFPADKPAIGLCFDGTGLGTDQAIWGGEVLLGSYAQFQRRFHLKYVPLPGGDVSVRIPARMALTHLWANQIDWNQDFACSQALCMEEKTALRIQLEHNLNSPPTSSMGRLFDAVASFIGIRQKVTYEGQAAIEMETLVDVDEKGFYPFLINKYELDPDPLWEQLIRDYLSGVPQSILAARFHNSITQLALQICLVINKESGVSTVALSGGVWQNTVLLTNTIQLLEKNNFKVLWHSMIPTNDGGIAYGQACVAANYMK